MISAQRTAGYKTRLAMLLLAASGALFAQTTASITGIVRDVEGRALGGATVVLNSSTARAAILHTVTDAEGNFALHDLRFGTYILTVELADGAQVGSDKVSVILPTTRVDFTVAASASGLASSGASSRKYGERSLPVFTPSGIHGTVAPSGYSTGLSSEETDQALRHVKDVSGDLLSAYMPTETAAGCGKKADLVAATLADPKSFAANRALGLFYLGHGEAARSIPYLQQSYAVAPDPVKSARELALAMIMAGQYSGAIPILKSAAANDRNNLVIRRLLALSYGAMGDLRRSAAEYKRASTLDSGADNLFECGIGLIGVGDGNDARQLFSAATHGNPGSAKLWTGLGIAQEFQQQKKEALRSLLRAVALDPDYIPPYAFLAGLVGVSADADSELQQRLAALVLARPDSAEAHYDYGLALWKKHMLSPAEVSIPEIQSQLRLAIELDPAMVRAHFQRGVLFADSGDYRDAVAEFQVVVKLQPNNATGHYRLAFAYRRQGRTEQANLEMRRFLDIHRSQETAGDTPGSDIQKAVLRQSHWKASAGPCPSDVRTLK